MDLRRWSMLASLLMLAALGEARAQDDAQPEDTLPEVVVEPDAELPSVDVSPDDDFSNVDDFDPRSITFPSLADQMTAELGDGLRGAPLSIFDNPRAIDIVTQQDLTERSPADMGQALEQTIGVTIQRTGRGQSSPYIRGLTGQQVLIMVDGVRLTNATFRAGPNQYFNTIDPHTVERIEVIRGPGTVLYGSDAIGGVINVVTKRASFTGYDYVTGGTVQRFSSADLGYSGRLDVEGWVGSTGVFTGAGYGNYNDLDVGGNPDVPPFVVGRQEATSWRYNSGDIKFNYEIDECSELVFALQHYRAEDVFRSDRFPANRQTIFDPQQRDLGYLRWQGYGSGIVTTYQITGSLSRTKEGRRESNPITQTVNVDDNKFVDEQTGVSAVCTTDMCEKGTLSYGVDWYHDEIDSWRRNVDLNTGATSPRSPTQFPNDAFYSRYGVFLNWDVWLSEKWLASAGTRFEHIEAGATITVDPPGLPPPILVPIDPEYQDVVGQAGLTYAHNDWLHFVGSFAEGFRAPNLDDLTAINNNVFLGVQLPNPETLPEHSYTWEVGAKVNTCNIRGEMYVWWTDFQDQILRVNNAAGGFTLLNVNHDSTLQGVDFGGEYLFDDEWSLYGYYSYVFGRDDIANVPLSKIPPAQGTVGLRKRWNCGNDWLDVYAWLVNDQDRLSPTDIADVNRIPVGGTPGYGTLNFRYGKLITERQRLSLNLENITDKEYRVHGSGSAGAGINAVVTYELLR